MRVLKYGCVVVAIVIVLAIGVFFVNDRSEKKAFMRNCGCEFNFARHVSLLLRHFSIADRERAVPVEYLPDDLRDIGIVRVYRMDEFRIFVLDEFQVDGKTVVTELAGSSNTLPGYLSRLKKLAPKGVSIYHAASMKFENWCCWQHDRFDFRQTNEERE